MYKPLKRYYHDYFLEVAKGHIPQHSIINKFGINTDIDTNTDPETIWSAGGIYSFPSSADTLKISSNDNNDNGTGTTGALEITVEGLDSNYNIISENFTLNGQTAVTSNKEFIRVYRAFVTSAGSSEYNEGVITINNSDDSIKLAEIPAEYGQTQMAIYTVPSNHRAFITNFSGAIVRTFFSAQTSLGLYFRENGVKKLKQEISLDSSSTSSYNKTYSLPLIVEEKTDIFVNSISVSTNNVGVFSNFGIVLVDQNGKYK